MHGKELIKSYKISEIVEAHNTACKELQEAEKLIQSAYARLRAHVASSMPLTGNTVTYLEYYKFKENSKKHLFCRTWQSILKQSKVAEVMSSARKKELDKQLEDGNMPELTVENIEATLQSVFGNMEDYATEAVKEVFDTFTRGRQWSKLKTHEKNKYQLKDKVILEGIIDTNYCFYSLRYEQQTRLCSLGNAFSLLDGKGVQKYPNDLYTQIQVFTKEGFGDYETEYFKLKLFKNGNAHIKFKRMDIVDKINAIGADGTLKGL